MENNDLKKLYTQTVKSVADHKASYESITKELASLEAKRAGAETSLRTAAEELSQFNQVFGKRLAELGIEKETTSTGTGRGRKAQAAATVPANGSKRGPKPKTATAAAAIPANGSKRGPKPKAANGSKRGRKASGEKQTELTAGQQRAAEAVAEGRRPSMKVAIPQVMGNETMNAEQITDALIARGWGPFADKPKQYISFVLSSTGDLFERVVDKAKGQTRGFYRLTAEGRRVAQEEAAKTSGSTRRTTKPVATETVPANTNGSKRGPKPSNGSKRNQKTAEAATTTNGSKRGPKAANGSKRGPKPSNGSKRNQKTPEVATASNGSKRGAETATASNGSKRGKTISTDDILRSAGLDKGGSIFGDSPSLYPPPSSRFRCLREL